jgi:hypothetical protein
MKKYIGVKLIEAEPALRKGGKVYLPNEPIPKSMDRVEEGYKVIYPDGYESWSPKDVFEEAYKPINGMTFGLAVEALKKGFKVTRNGWNGKGLWIELKIPDTNSKMTRPYIYIVCPKGSTKHFGEQTKDFEMIPWIPGQNDILSEDWQVVEIGGNK